MFVWMHRWIRWFLSFWRKNPSSDVEVPRPTIIPMPVADRSDTYKDEFDLLG